MGAAAERSDEENVIRPKVRKLDPAIRNLRNTMGLRFDVNIVFMGK
tara:strand:- start:137 stop:274 length:138 start_codon:yes stop_codon:yes gene_type:complete